MAQRIRRQRKTFCTECGTDLDDFWLTPGASDYKEVLKHHLECQRTDRFKGSMCSKLFIIDGGTPEQARATTSVSPRKHSSMKKSILKKIESEAKKTPRR